MKNVRVELGKRSYDIVIGENSSELLNKFVDNRRTLLVFDDRTKELYSEKFAFANEAKYSFGRGEKDKTVEKMVSICRAAVNAGLNRSSVLVAIGGGVTGDMTGFAAGILLRGVDFIQVPTSLLAMVDSSVGGKTAVDLPEGKNLVGVFHQPQAVLIDPEFLNTLPVRELRCGMAEVIKMAAGFDAGFFEKLEAHAEMLAAVKTFMPLAIEVIGRCCELKADVVRRDETESVSGVRELLNFGHTFGHAIETLSDFSLSHGECVAIGMVIAGRAALLRNMWSEAFQSRLITLLKKAGLPVAPPEGMPFPDILQLMRRDKKNRDGRIALILPESLGKLTVKRDFTDDELRQVWESFYD
ncbi:MAG: 3-dehydroquinate synthase [Lentisphaerae bacterium]|nr:3-dehydroquinate synthase [Lentisphaerota bacterium]